MTRTRSAAQLCCAKGEGRARGSTPSATALYVHKGTQFEKCLYGGPIWGSGLVVPVSPCAPPSPPPPPLGLSRPVPW